MGNAQARGGGGGGLRNSKEPILPESTSVNPLCHPSNPVNGTSALPLPSSQHPRAPATSSMLSLSTFGAPERVEKPQQQPPSLFADGSARGGRGRNGDKSSRRVLVAVEEASNAPHQCSISPSPNELAPSQSVRGTIASQSPSATVEPRRMASKARDILRGIFFPRQGELECVLSGFLTRENYALMRRFWAPFLTTELRDKWYIDAVMLSVLGRDRWQSWGQPKEAACVALSREEVLQLNQKRRECYDRLRERLTELSGALMEKGDHRGKKGNRETLLADNHSHEVAVSGVSVVESDGISCSGKDGNHRNPDARWLGRTSTPKPDQHCVPGATTTVQRQEPLSVLLMRLQTTVSTSFDCFDLIAARVPAAIVSSLASQYFSSSTPVVYQQVAYQEKKIGDLDALSFFVSIESRRQLLNGRVPADMNRNATSNMKGHNNVDPGDFVPFTREDKEDPIQTTQQLYSAVRHAGLVVTTACSSMVLTVLFHLADVLRERQALRDNKAKAAQLGVTLERLIGHKAAPVHTYSDKAVEKLEALKRDVVRGEMSLTVLAKELVSRFRSENRAKMEKLRDCYPDLFGYLQMAATPEERHDFDVTRLLSGIALKLMFLTGGGQRSIVADDRRVPAGGNRITDDVALSAMLEVPILNLICWIGCMMGMPIMSSHGLLAPQHQGKPPLTLMEMDECCGAMRVLFQAVGALPCGNACPQNIKEWFPLFPFYAVNSEGKRVLLYLYTAEVTAIQRVPLTLQKDMTLLSFATALTRAMGGGMADVSNYFFEPNFTVGHPPCNADSNNGMAGEDATQRSASSSEPMLPSMSGSGASWSKSTAFECRTSPSVSPSPTAADGKACRDERRSSSASSDASSACSTLMEENLNIDVYTCMNPQMRLYVRCSNEATTHRHGVTELTPFVSTTFYCSTRDIEADRPDIAPVLRHAVPKLLPSEGLLTLRWTSGEPLVTFCAGDLVSVMAERVATSAAGGGDAARVSSSAQQQQQSRTYSAPDFTGATPRVSEGNGALDALMSGKEGAIGAADDNSGNAAAARARTHLATIDEPEKHSSDTVSSLHSHAGAYNTALEDGSMTMSSGDCAAPETAHAYQGVMHDVLGLHEKVSRRIGVQWKVLEVLPCSPLVRRSCRMSGSNSLSAVAAAGKQDESDGHKTYYREVVLHVTAPDMLFAAPLRILTIGHERASMSAFTFVDPNDDTVCWSNPNLIASILNGDRSQDGGKSSRPALADVMAAAANERMLPAAAAAAAAVRGGRPVPSGLLCDTEEALHSIYYSIGVLLGNAITNGVHFTAPIAPLAFLLMKKAIMSGDYSFKNFMWLEPADGNLLSPTLLLNSAYEILNMTDHQYVAFLHMRALGNPDSHIFPVVHSLADEIREDKASLQQQQQSHSPASSSKQQHRRQGSKSVKLRLHQQSRDATSASIPLDRSLNAPRTPASVLGYLESIQAYNRTGSAFHRSNCDMSNDSGGGGSCVHPFLLGAHVPVRDAIQAYREQLQRRQTKAMKSSAPPLVRNSRSNDQLHGRLPSRREYISLYLANDLAWSPVRRDGHGAKNKELWVSMARGFMTSSLAKSPLMTHCCSRVIREVLCVPRTAS